MAVSGPTAVRNSVELTVRYPGEYNLNLAEYMVILDKPLGLTLAPDPITGQIIVQNVKEGSPAASCQLIQVGDVVKMCSAVFGEDMWQAIDIRRIRWAINNRTSKIKLVLERSRRSNNAPTWYSKGQVGRASVERDTLQLPVSFTSNSVHDDWAQELVAPGRPMYAGFHRSVMGAAQVASRSSPAAAGRAAALQRLRGELVAARQEPEMDLTAVYSRVSSVTSHPTSVDGSVDSAGPPSSASSSTSASAAAGSSSSSGGAAGSSGAAAAAAAKQGPKQQVVRKEKKVTPVLPWLLVSSGRLDTRDLTHIASYKGLGAMLELGLTMSSGSLAVRGTEGVPVTEVNVSTLLQGTSPTAAPPEADTGSSAGPLSSSPSLGGTRRLVPTSSLQGRDGRSRMLVHAAASLQRLAFRRRGSSLHHSSPDRCAVLLHCEGGLTAEVTRLLAGWLHWYRRMPLQEAILSAELATGTAIDQALLEEATEYLVSGAEERMSKVVLTWKYPALTALVAGDLVGGWQHPMPLLRCKNPLGCKGSTARGHFFLELTGLPPGVYYYKYVIDNTWTVDPTAPKVLDTAGNYNNVLEVHERPPIMTSRERLSMARWQAAHLALENKMIRYQ
eukprot:CAMPEP_0202922760 /NCGR_PEP_ID=MMETSP1392-20130828/78093_1 /ASSEMBLY_ACC=CAM_ASM_000868 /TAXON_ID=225041 /ORGANISM="Chlamydomonas chlamydogama, Strain SAG 11-48b" /LENGTH=614 /DNA_ID=CAMNT_0049616405 /DNA_START=224 /DNA_END=2068 /DNA_ORIENTATION=-